MLLLKMGLGILSCVVVVFISYTLMFYIFLVAGCSKTWTINIYSYWYNMIINGELVYRSKGINIGKKNIENVSDAWLKHLITCVITASIV